MASGSQTCGFGNLGAATNCSVSKFHQVSPVARPQKQFIHSHQQPNEVWGGLPFRGPSNWAVVRLQGFGAHHIIRDNEVIQKRTTPTGYTLVFWGINGARMVGCWGCFMDLYGMFFFLCDLERHVTSCVSVMWWNWWRSVGTPRFSQLEKRTKNATEDGLFSTKRVQRAAFIWVKLITTSLRPNPGIMVNKGNHPQMALFQVSEIL